MIKGLVAALVAGAVGAAIWAAVTHFTGYEVGFVAWGVGLLVGIGMFAGAGNNAGMATGVVAAVVAIAAVLGGKYATVHLAVEQFAGAMNHEMTEHDVLVRYADRIAGEWEAQGRTVAWPIGSSVETAYNEEDYPADVWAEAEARWDALDEKDRRAALAHDVLVGYADRIAASWDEQGHSLAWPEDMSIETAYAPEDYPPDVWEAAETQWESLDVEGQQAAIDQQRASAEASFGSFTAEARDQIFIESFTLFDLLWIGLALFTAFKVGAGAAGDE